MKRTNIHRWFPACTLLAALVAAGCSDDPPEATSPDSALVTGTTRLHLELPDGERCISFMAEEANGGPAIGPKPIPDQASDEGYFEFLVHLPPGEYSYTGYLDCVNGEGQPVRHESFLGSDIDTREKAWDLVFTFTKERTTHLNPVGIEFCPAVAIVSVVPGAPCAGVPVLVTYEIDAPAAGSACQLDVAAQLGDDRQIEPEAVGQEARSFTLTMTAPEAPGVHLLETDRVTLAGNSRSLEPLALTIVECRVDEEEEGPGDEPEGGDACSGIALLTGPDATDDALLKGNSHAPDHDEATGESSELQVGSLEWHAYWRTRTVMRFDLASIPEGATVLDAELQLFVHRECSSTGPNPANCGSLDPDTYEVTFHALLRDWVESEVSWNRASAAEAWAVPGANDAASDRNGPADAVLSGLNSTAGGTFQLVDVTDSVQDFVAGELPNNGWVLIGPNVGHYQGRIIQIRSSEYNDPADPAGAAALRPLLTVEWELPGCEEAPMAE